MKRKYEIAVISKDGFARSVRIFAPKKADRAIIMHDGQNVFREEDAVYKKSWRACDLLKKLGIKNVAVIGVDCAPTREFDYMPFPSELTDRGVNCGGRADAYMDYIENMLVPYLDKRFGFKSYAMLGSSAGGAATLYFASRCNPRFSVYGMYSTPLFVSSHAYTEFFKTATFPKEAAYFVYAGGSERTASDKNLADLEPDLFVSDAYKVTDAVRKSGAKDVFLTVINSGLHDETAWREVFPQLLSYFSNLSI